MLTKEETQRKLRESFPELSRRYGLKRIGIFGSVARDSQSEDSDVDLVVEFERPVGLRFVDFADELERILGTKTDILTPFGIDSIRNRGISERIRGSVEYVEPL